MIRKVEPKITKAFDELIKEFNSEQEYDMDCISFDLGKDCYKFKIPNPPYDPKLEIVSFQDLETYLNSVAKCHDLDCMPVDEIKEVLKPQFRKEFM